MVHTEKYFWDTLKHRKIEISTRAYLRQEMLPRVPVAALDLTRSDATADAAAADGVHRSHRLGGRLLLLAEAALLRPRRASTRLELLQASKHRCDR